MMAADRVKGIWWRVLQPGEFFNIERRPDLIVGGGGSRYIEIPSSLVDDTLDFFDYEQPRVNEDGFTISAASIGKVSQVAPINFLVKTGGRLRIANQNRQATPNRRHPAWSAVNGFPQAPDSVPNKEAAMVNLPQGGVRIFIAKTQQGDYLAGYTKGSAPSYIPLSSPLQALYANSGVGGVLRELDLPLNAGMAKA